MQTVQVKLLNNGGYCKAENVNFPVVVTGTLINNHLCDIHHDELHRVGFGDMTDDTPWPFLIGEECEVVLKC